MNIAREVEKSFSCKLEQDLGNKIRLRSCGKIQEFGITFKIESIKKAMVLTELAPRRNDKGSFS